MATVVEVLARLRADTSQFNSAMDSASGKMKSIGASMTNVGKRMTAGVTLPIVGIGVAAIAIQKDFETSMNTLAVMTGEPAAGMEKLSDLAKQMGADTVFSAGESATAMVELAKAGFTAAEISAGGLQATMALAATEGIELATAATIVTQTMNAFGLSAEDAMSAVDILAAGAVASTASVEELSGGLKYVGSTAGTMKIPLGEVVSALSALSNAGVDGTTAGTSLNRMLLGLAGTTTKAKNVIKDYGLEFYDANGQIRPMVEIVGQLEDAFGNLTDKQRTTALKDLFGVEGMRAANLLIAEGVDGFNKLGAAVGQQGVAQELADARMSGTAGALEELSGSIETAVLAIGEALAPVVKTVAGFIKEIADRFQALSPQIQQGIVIFAGLAAAIGPLLIVAGMLATAIAALASPVGAVIAIVVGVIAAIAALAAGLKYAYDNFEGFRNVVNAVWEGIQQSAQATVQFFVGTVWPLLQQVFSNIATAAKALWQNGIRPAFEGIQAAVDMVVGAFMEHMWPNIQKVFGFIGDAATALVEDFIRPNWEKIMTVVGPVVSWMQSNVMPILSAVFTAIGAYVRFMANAWATAFSFIMSVVGPVIGWFVDNVGPVIMAVFRGIWTVLGMLVDFTVFYWQAIITVVGAAVDWFSNTMWPAMQTAFQLVVGAVQALWGGIQAAFSAITGAVSSAVSTVASVLGTIGGVISTVVGFFANLVTGVTTHISTAITTVSGIPGRILSALGSLGSLLYNAGRSIIQGLINGLQSMFGSVRDWFTNLTSSLTSWKGPESVDRKLLTRSGQLIMDGFIAGLESRRGDVRSSLQSLTAEVGAFSPELGAGRVMRVQASMPNIGAGGPEGVGSQSRGGIHIENLNVTAAPGERADSSVPRQLRRMAWVAGLNG